MRVLIQRYLISFFLGFLILSHGPFSQGGDQCAGALSRLTSASRHLSQEDKSLSEVKGELLKATILESPLFSSQPFISAVEEAAGVLRTYQVPIDPQHQIDQEGITKLEAEIRWVEGQKLALQQRLVPQSAFDRYLSRATSSDVENYFPWAVESVVSVNRYLLARPSEYPRSTTGWNRSGVKYEIGFYKDLPGLPQLGGHIVSHPDFFKAGSKDIAQLEEEIKIFRSEMDNIDQKTKKLSELATKNMSTRVSAQAEMAASKEALRMAIYYDENEIWLQKAKGLNIRDPSSLNEVIELFESPQVQTWYDEPRKRVERSLIKFKEYQKIARENAAYDELLAEFKVQAKPFDDQLTLLAAEHRALKTKYDNEEALVIKKKNFISTAADLKFKTLPSVTLTAAADKIWNKLVQFYSLPGNYDDLSLADFEKVNLAGKRAGLDSAQMKQGHILITAVEKDPVLKAAVLATLSNILEDVQGQPLSKLNSKKLFKTLQDRDLKLMDFGKDLISTEISSFSPDTQQLSFSNASPFSQEKGDLKSMDLTAFLIQEHSIFLNEIYFKVVRRSVAEAGYNLDDAVANYHVYTDSAKAQITDKIWKNLKETYSVETLLLPLDPFWLGHRAVELATSLNIDADTFLKNSYAIKALDQNSETQKAVLSVIDSSFYKTAQFIIQLDKAQKSRDLWKTWTLKAPGIRSLIDGRYEKVLQRFKADFHTENSYPTVGDTDHKLKTISVLDHPEWGLYATDLTMVSKEGRAVTFNNYSPFSHKHNADVTTSIGDLVARENPLLLSSEYLEIFKGIFKNTSLNLEDILKNYETLPLRVRQDLSLKVWDELKRVYAIDAQSLSDPKLIKALAANNTLVNADVWVRNSFLVRAIDQNPEAKSVVLEFITESFYDTAKLATKLQKRNWFFNRTSAIEDFKTATLKKWQTAANGSSAEE